VGFSVFSSLAHAISLLAYHSAGSGSVPGQARPCGRVVNKGALGRVFLRVLGLSSVSTTPLMLHTHSLILHRRNIVTVIGTAVKYRTLTHAYLNSYSNSNSYWFYPKLSVFPPHHIVVGNLSQYYTFAESVQLTLRVG